MDYWKRKRLLFWIVFAILLQYTSCQDTIEASLNEADTEFSGAAENEDTSESIGGAVLAPNPLNPNLNGWFPRLNVTCINGTLSLLENPNCINGEEVTQQKCTSGAFGGDKDGQTCQTIQQRTLPCRPNAVCTDWVSWSTWTRCCNKINSTCFNGVELRTGQRAKLRTRKCRKDVSLECGTDFIARQCATGRQGNGGSGLKGSADGTSAIRTIAFTLVGCVMVGLLLFAAMRLKKNGLFRRRAPPIDREMQGFDNEIGPSSPESRIQTILNTINSNGRNFELRERSDSIPGRRIYVLSPTAQDPTQFQIRGRGLSRMPSQLSSIAEEETDEALSQITEGTEPADEDDCVFEYDSDAINEVDKLQLPGEADTVTAREDTKGASSSEALDYIDDVIAMYDVDNGVANKESISELLKNNSPVSAGDFRTSGDYEDSRFLQNYGWSPQERSWKVEKLKDESMQRDNKLSASLSTLDSRFSDKSVLTSSASVLSLPEVKLHGDDSREPLLGSEEATSSTRSLSENRNLQNSLNFKSLPSVLDTSLIPDIDEVLRNDAVTDSGVCDVTQKFFGNGDLQC